MIRFKNLNDEAPFKIFKKKYDEASGAGQRSIEAISISSYSKDFNEVNSRYVNLKFVDNKEFIFFTNYSSPKSKEFKSHRQISALIYWNSINVQIRIKATIEKTSLDFNKEYFKERSFEKNALALSSEQSSPIDSFKTIKDNYNKVLLENDLSKCPKYWGGFRFVPYYFEFWEGHESRLNKRDVYQAEDNIWKHLIIQP
jgi:pyridoxamine 5'-phosphate oxidase